MRYFLLVFYFHGTGNPVGKDKAPRGGVIAADRPQHLPITSITHGQYQPANDALFSPTVPGQLSVYHYLVTNQPTNHSLNQSIT